MSLRRCRLALHFFFNISAISGLPLHPTVISTRAGFPDWKPILKPGALIGSTLKATPASVNASRTNVTSLSDGPKILTPTIKVPSYWKLLVVIFHPLNALDSCTAKDIASGSFKPIKNSTLDGRDGRIFSSTASCSGETFLHSTLACSRSAFKRSSSASFSSPAARSLAFPADSFAIPATSFALAVSPLCTSRFVSNDFIWTPCLLLTTNPLTSATAANKTAKAWLQEYTISQLIWERNKGSVCESRQFSSLFLEEQKRFVILSHHSNQNLLRSHGRLPSIEPRVDVRTARVSGRPAGHGRDGG
jgi:hypothetical protein